jgi:hypothetical protein
MILYFKLDYLGQKISSKLLKLALRAILNFTPGPRVELHTLG